MTMTVKKRARRTDVHLMIDALKDLGGTWGTEQKCVEALIALGWTDDRAARTVRRAIDGDAPLERGKGGTLKFSGTDLAIYDEVVRKLVSHWGPSRGLRNCWASDCHHPAGLKDAGVWAYPDVVLLADPKRRASATDPLEIHAIEVERNRGFDIRSVYQAYEQGRGANYSWVFFVGTPDKSRLSWLRIARAAKDRGVGLVSMGKPHAVTTWVEHVPAIRRNVDPARGDRQQILLATGITAEQLNERLHA